LRVAVGDPPPPPPRPAERACVAQQCMQMPFGGTLCTTPGGPDPSDPSVGPHSVGSGAAFHAGAPAGRRGRRARGRTGVGLKLARRARRAARRALKPTYPITRRTRARILPWRRATARVLVSGYSARRAAPTPRTFRAPSAALRAGRAEAAVETACAPAP